MRPPGSAIVVGSGPGGLSAALALDAAGIEPVVFERSARDTCHGSGLTLWPNAMKALRVVDAAQAVELVSLPADGIELRSWRGDVLAATPGEFMSDRFGGTGVALTRSELLATLRDVAERRGIELRFQMRFVRLDQDAHRVTAVFDTGSEHHADMLIGADGIRSPVGTQLFSGLGLRQSGDPVWRGVTSVDLPRGVGVTALGRGAQFGFFPMTHRRVYWFASARSPGGSCRSVTNPRSWLLARFRDWHAPIPHLIAATDDDAIVGTDVYRRTSLCSWSLGRVALLGDAAHPIAPHLGQGACQAIEDAVVLGEALRGGVDVPRAFSEYERRRRPRTARITSQARWLGWAGELRTAPACRVRDSLLRALPDRVRFSQLQDLFAFSTESERLLSQRRRFLSQ